MTSKYAYTRFFLKVHKCVFPISVLDEDVKAELLRCPLENSILRVKLLDMGEPKALLALALEPPDWLNIDRTILTLKEVGALTLTADGNLAITPDDGDLSYLGRVIARLPLDIHLGKLIMLGNLRLSCKQCRNGFIFTISAFRLYFQRS
jgi:ATP-dependent RNA helicase TDRD9